MARPKSMATLRERVPGAGSGPWRRRSSARAATARRSPTAPEQAAGLRRDARRRIEERAARAAPKIQLVVALVLVPSVLLMILAALVAHSDALFGAVGLRAPASSRSRLATMAVAAQSESSRWRLPLAPDVAAERPGLELEGEVLRGVVGEPDQEGRLEDPAGRDSGRPRLPVKILYRRPRPRSPSRSRWCERRKTSSAESRKRNPDRRWRSSFWTNAATSGRSQVAIVKW